MAYWAIYDNDVNGMVMDISVPFESEFILVSPLRD